MKRTVQKKTQNSINHIPKDEELNRVAGCSGSVTWRAVAGCRRGAHSDSSRTTENTEIEGARDGEGATRTHAQTLAALARPLGFSPATPPTYVHNPHLLTRRRRRTQVTPAPLPSPWNVCGSHAGSHWSGAAHSDDSLTSFRFSLISLISPVTLTTVTSTRVSRRDAPAATEVRTEHNGKRSSLRRTATATPPRPPVAAQHAH